MNLTKSIGVGLAVVGLAISTQAATFTLTLAAGTATNALQALSGINSSGGLIKLSQVSVTATTASNTLVYVYDAPLTNYNGVLNALSYTNAPYTNTLSVLTNMITSITNWYGVVQSLTNYQLIDITNNAVSGSTNLYPLRIAIAAAAGTTYTYPNQNYYFQNGILITNASPTAGNASFTFTYTQ